MYDTAQRVSVVLEQYDEDGDWAVVALLIDEGGRRQRSTLGRFTTRDEAARYLSTIYESLPRKQKISV
jgi:hypothetical protein